MISLSLSARMVLGEPNVDYGLVTWFGVAIHRRDAEEDDDANEQAQQIGRAEIALVHVGAAGDYGESLSDVLDADSGDLEALYYLYFDEDSGWFKDDFAGADGPDLAYIRGIAIDPAWQGRSIELAVVQRLHETIASGCKVLVISVSSPEEVTRWKEMGFEVPEGKDPGVVHLNLQYRRPRVVPWAYPRDPAPHEDDRFKVLPVEGQRLPAPADEEDGGEDEEPQPAESSSLASTPTAGRTHSAAVRGSTLRRRPSRRRR